jgi:D-aminopeptidase
VGPGRDAGISHLDDGQHEDANDIGHGRDDDVVRADGRLGRDQQLAGGVIDPADLHNFGDRERLTIDGVPVGRLLSGPAAGDSQSAGVSEGGGRLTASTRPAGSCITVAITDAPLDAAACTRLARRAGLGLARTGSTAHHGSGEIFLALATGLRAPGATAAGVTAATGSSLDPLLDAVVEATEEAVLTSMLAAPIVVGRDGNTSPGLPAARVRALLATAGRC